jgi:hypothetical protein
VFNEEEVIVIVAEINSKFDNAEATTSLIAATLFEVHAVEVYSIIICQIGTLPRTKDGFVNTERLYQFYFTGVLNPLSVSCSSPRMVIEKAKIRPNGKFTNKCYSR